jgi:hypothetical protein
MNKLDRGQGGLGGEGHVLDLLEAGRQGCQLGDGLAESHG